MDTPSPQVSIVTCTVERRDGLSRLLSSLALQRGIERCEVIVVDNADSADNRALVERFRTNYPTRLRVVTEPRRGLSMARNRGWQEGLAEFIAYVDDDMTLADEWLPSILEAIGQEQFDGYGGPIEARLPSLPDRDFGLLLAEARDPVTGSLDLGEATFVFGPDRGGTPWGGNMGFQRSLIEQLGGFRVDLGWAEERIPGEETDFCMRAVASGFHIHYLPNAKTFHHLERTHLSAEYFRTYHRGGGRALIRLAPPTSTTQWLRELARHVVKYIGLLFLDTRPTSPRGLRRARRMHRTTGRIIELWSSR